MTAAATKVELTIPVEGGKLNPSPAQQQTIDRMLATREGKAVVLKLSRPVNSRSQRQNRFYWGVMIPLLADHSGDTHEDMHDFLRQEFLPRRFVEFAGRRREVRKSTADLSVEEFSVYLEQLAALAAESGLVIPDRP